MGELGKQFLPISESGAGASLVGAKGAGSAFKQLGAGKFTISAAKASVATTSFSMGQIAAAATRLGGLYDSVSEAGFDPNNISIGTLGDSAIVSAVGGDISFNAETGAITAQLPATLGSRLGKTITLSTLEKNNIMGIL